MDLGLTSVEEATGNDTDSVPSGGLGLSRSEPLCVAGVMGPADCVWLPGILSQTQETRLLHMAGTRSVTEVQNQSPREEDSFLAC